MKKSRECHPEELGAEVRTRSLFVEDREAPVVGDQLQALRAHGAVPADLEIPELLLLVILALANRDHLKLSLPLLMARQG